MSGPPGRRRVLRMAAGGLLAGTAVGGVPAALGQGTGTVVGIVSNLTGDPVEGADAALLEDNVEVATAQTDSNGAFGLAAEPGTYQLVVEKEGFSPFSDTVTIEEDGQQVSVDITLGPPDLGAVVGIVVDEPGNRVEGATMTLFDGNTELDAAETNQDGQYALPALAGSYVLEARAAGFQPTSETVTVESAESTVLNVTLPPGPPSLPGFDDKPQDLDGDGLFEDVDGNGTFDIFDVQALFTHLDSDAVQNHPTAFNFNENFDPGEVTIFDVQQLFDRLTEQV